MNKVEEFVYHLVYKNPTLKLAIRNLYQGCYDLLPRKKEFFKGKVCYKEGYFLGFHDNDAFSEDGLKVLAVEEYFDGRMPKAGEKVGIGYFDFTEGNLGAFHKLDDCYAWNWHKGCRLQWISNKELIFNTAVNDKIVSIIINIETHDKKILDSPVDTVLKSEQIASTFSYERLQYCMPGYGYPYSDESFLEEDKPNGTGLFLLDLETGKKDLIVTISELAEQAPAEFREGYIHYVTHTEFSHDGRYLSFLHRWIRKEGTNLKRWTRIMVFDRDKKTIIELPSQISGSHYVWNKRNQLLASCIIDNKSCHVLFDMNHVKNYKIVAPEILNQDGHQSFIDEDNFITDTYPDKRRMAKLYRVNIPSQTVELIANTYSPKEFQSFRTTETGHIACDLHPRVSSSSKYVCFDCPSTGKRGLYIMSL